MNLQITIRRSCTVLALALAGMFAGGQPALHPEPAIATCEQDECEPFFLGRRCQPNPVGWTACDMTAILSCRTYACSSPMPGSGLRGDKLILK